MYKLEIEPSETLHTKFGTAQIGNTGYYYISTKDKGNQHKLLHRLIYEDFYGTIPKDCIIHHKDNNCLNNCLMNLQILNRAKHIELHHTGSYHSNETCVKISKSLNSTGYFRVHKQKDSRIKQGFLWKYQYWVDGKQKSITRVNLDDLKEEVLKRGLKWEKI